MTLNDLYTLAMMPALNMLPPRMRSTSAQVLLLAIAGQESGLTHRAQVVNGGGLGPARGFLQFELHGGTAGVMVHRQTRQHAIDICERLSVPFVPLEVWRALENNDILAFTFGRLLIYTDAMPLPLLGDVETSWDYYLRCWRPGKPHPKAWANNYADALDFIQGRPV